MAKGRGNKVNRTELAATFGVSLPTVDQWVRDGCPFDQRGAGRGKPWVFDTADVAAWREARARDDGTDADGADLKRHAERLKARKLTAEAGLAELELAKKMGLVAPVDEFERAQAKMFAVVQQNVLNVVQRAAISLLGETDEARFKEVLRKELADALEKAAAAEIEDDPDGEDVDDDA